MIAGIRGQTFNDKRINGFCFSIKSIIPISMESTARRLPGLDLLRAIAVLWVITFHFHLLADDMPLSSFGQFGWMGVDLFFVLSGFLIGEQLLRPLARGEKLSYKNFFIRRTFRTLPNYFFVLALYFLFPLLREHPNIQPLWKFLTFTQNFGLSRIDARAFSHAWSLCVEEQFYLALPFLAGFVFKGKTARTLCLWFGIIVVAGIILRAGIWIYIVKPQEIVLSSISFASFFAEHIYYPTYARLDGLLVGVALALIKVFRPKLWLAMLGHGKRFLVLGLVILAVVISRSTGHYNLTAAALAYPLIAFAFGSLLVASLSPKIWISQHHIPGVQFMASLSYVMYLIQKMVFHVCGQFLHQLGHNSHTFGGFAIMMVVLIIVSFVIYSVIEQPFMNLRQKLLQNGAYLN